MKTYNTSAEMKESMRLSDRRVITELLARNRGELYQKLMSAGYRVHVISDVWTQVSKSNDESKIIVQLEIDPEGSNLDMVLLLPTESRECFPLGGSWKTKSTTKLTDDNIDFSLRRIESFFGIVTENDNTGAYVYENVVRDIKNDQKLAH